MPKGMLTDSRINPAKVLEEVHDPSAGGTVIFLGTIRDSSAGRKVVGLDYEVYKEMAERKMLEIERRVRKKWPVKKIAMVHRYGHLRVGEVSVAVAVSSEHRSEAFEACRYAIDAIKKSLPLWKKERLKAGTASWVRGEPIEA